MNGLLQTISKVFKKEFSENRDEINHINTAGIDFSDMVFLLADDTEAVLHYNKEILLEAGAKVECAEDGIQAINMFEDSEEGYYNVILTDINMPCLDGLQVTKYIRESGRSDSNVIIFALTTTTAPMLIEYFMESGINNFIEKPLDINLLQEKLYQHAICTS